MRRQNTSAVKPPATPADPAAGGPVVPQYSRAMVLAVWAAAAGPMAVLAWLVAPALAGTAPSPRRFFLVLLSALTVGLLWQAVLVLILVMRERRDPSWTNVRDRLWLRAPRTSTRQGGRL